MRADRAEAVFLISEQAWGHMMVVKERIDRERARVMGGRAKENDLPARMFLNLVMMSQRQRERLAIE